MNLKINRVIDYGTLASERVNISVLEDCNLRYYIVIDTTYVGDTAISNKMRHMHWFTPRDVKKGDEVLFYTKSGITKTEEINGGKNKRYTLFWNLGNPVWNNTGDAAVLFEVKTWKTTKVVVN
ncbi:hypothetical protein EG348_03425 [Chryseobacterium sp. G0201]|nr:hypothetical protein EG348_03425 [Chryseobacterium sp. G0201]